LGLARGEGDGALRREAAELDAWLEAEQLFHLRDDADSGLGFAGGGRGSRSEVHRMEAHGRVADRLSSQSWGHATGTEGILNSYQPNGDKPCLKGPGSSRSPRSE